MAHECVVHNYLLDRQGGGTQLPHEAIDRQDHDCIYWSHIEYDLPDSYEWLMAQGLNENVVDTLTRPESRPRMLSYQSGTVLILRAVNLNPGQDVEDMVSIRIWIEKDRIISVRQRPILSIQDIRAAVEIGQGPKTEGEFVVMLTERLAARIGEAVDDIEEKITRCEAAVLENNDDIQLSSDISALRRKTAAIRRFLAPQRDALDAVYRLPNNLLTADESHQLREQTDRITRYVEDLDLARELTLVVQEDLRNRTAQEQNSRTYLLSVVAAIFLPLGFLTGVFGMNVGGMPGLENPWGFLWVCVGMFGVALGTIVYMRSKHWI